MAIAMPIDAYPAYPVSRNFQLTPVFPCPLPDPSSAAFLVLLLLDVAVVWAQLDLALLPTLVRVYSEPVRVCLELAQVL
jgi:hypothetical protein